MDNKEPFRKVPEKYVIDSMDSTRFKQKLLDLRDELRIVEKSGDEAASTVELDQSKVGRLSRMDALQSQALAKEAQQRRTIQKQRIESALARRRQTEP